MKVDSVHNMDCLEFMKAMPDDCVDLIITDPPYGINVCRNGVVGISNHVKAQEYDPCEWDDAIPSQEVFNEMLRVSKNQVIFGGNYMTHMLPQSNGWVVWDKRNDGSFFADCELAWTSFDRAIRVYRHRWFGMLQEDMKWKERRVHPTQKPIGLGRWIIKNYADEGDIIFDPFAGSGSFILAAKQMSHHFIGCELNEKYCEIIRERLSQKTLMEVLVSGDQDKKYSCDNDRSESDSRLVGDSETGSAH